jgi:MoxR-like ATPase
MEARGRIAELYMDERIVDYIVDIVHATRTRPRRARSWSADRVRRLPRATIALAAGVARARLPARPHLRDSPTT